MIEHIIPTSKGGQTNTNNLALACGGCNGYKYNKTEGVDPVNGVLVKLYNPRTDEWKEHFAWNDDHLEIMGITPTGRATVVTLKLNRKEVINLREINLLTGEHPPVR